MMLPASYNESRKWTCRECKGRLQITGTEAVCVMCGIVQNYNPWSEYTYGKLTMCEKESYSNGSIKTEFPTRILPIIHEIEAQVLRIEGVNLMAEGLSNLLVQKAKDIILSCCGPGGEDEGIVFLFPIPRNIQVLTTAVLLSAVRETDAFKGTLTSSILNSVNDPSPEFEKKVLCLKNDLMSFRASRKKVTLSSEVGLLEQTVNRECNILGFKPKVTQVVKEMFLDLCDRVVCNGQNPRFVLAGVIEHLVVKKCSRRAIEIDDTKREEVHEMILERLRIKEKLLGTIDFIIKEDHGC